MRATPVTCCFQAFAAGLRQPHRQRLPKQTGIQPQQYRLFSEALAADPKLADDRQIQIRYNAACAASLAGCGKGKDDPAPDEGAKTLLRQQALDWLQVELATWTTLLASVDESQRAAIAQTFEHWKVDSDLGGIRDAVGLETLPEAERESWKALWTQVDELLAKANEQPDKEQP